ATIRSGIYQSTFKLIGKEITTIAIPDLAPAIEVGAPAAEIKAVIRDGLATVNLADFDVLILACTHYPLVLDYFKELVPPSMALFDPAIAAAERAEKLFWPQEVGGGTTTFL